MSFIVSRHDAVLLYHYYRWSGQPSFNMIKDCLMHQNHYQLSVLNKSIPPFDVSQNSNSMMYCLKVSGGRYVMIYHTLYMYILCCTVMDITYDKHLHVFMSCYLQLCIAHKRLYCVMIDAKLLINTSPSLLHYKVILCSGSSQSLWSLPIIAIYLSAIGVLWVGVSENANVWQVYSSHW